ncbi:MAG: hypothetical protein OXI15_02275 [Chromatiales bacterium]|nr:hypothetical protein [Chromatiales bacterium]
MTNPKTIHQDRVRRIRTLTASLPAFPGDLTDDIQTTPGTHLMTGEGAIDAFNMVTVYGLRTDGCGTVGCIAGLTVQEYPDLAAQTRRRIAHEYNWPIDGVDILDVAGDILGLDHTTRNELFCAVSSPWADDLGRASKEAVIGALDRILDGHRGPAIWTPVRPEPATARR